MLLEKITPEELELAEYIHDPVALTSCLFTSKINSFTDLKNYDEEDFFKIRLYQYPFLSYEYMIAEDPELSDEENFELKKNAGTCYGYSGRATGKSLVGIVIDLLLDCLHNAGVTLFSAFTEGHVKKILDPVVYILENHPFFKKFKFNCTSHPHYVIESSSLSHILKGINAKIHSKNPGSSFEGEHARKIVIDEHQYETQEVANKRSQSGTESGFIERCFGITSFKKNSPAGKNYFDMQKKKFLINLPAYISPQWKYRKQQSIRDYGGTDTVGWKTNIEARVVEDAEGLYQIDRIRSNAYIKNKIIKRFEIDKEDFKDFKTIIVVEKPKNASRVFICGDFGESPSPTEIIIIFEIDGHYYRYDYNITLTSLIPEEQYEVFRWLATEVEANFIGVDATEIGGKEVLRRLAKVFNSDNLIYIKFNENLEVDFEKDEEGKVIYKNGEPVYKKENTKDWGVYRIKKLLYSGKLKVPEDDYKFDTQFNSMVYMKSGYRIKYGTTADQDHLHDAFLVFGVVEWKVGNYISEPCAGKVYSKGGVW